MCHSGDPGSTMGGWAVTPHQQQEHRTHSGCQHILGSLQQQLSKALKGPLSQSQLPYKVEGTIMSQM